MIPLPMRSACLAFSFALLAGCGSFNPFSVYKMEVQQGNYVTQEMVDQLKPGMTRDQVRFALGTPLLTDIFHDNRWDYVFRRQRSGAREVEERRLSVFFKDDKLDRVEGDVVPAPSPAEAKAQK
jgi:outer membrane protein assembly factor BamE